MSDFHSYKASLNPRLEGSCERCGRAKSHAVHISLLMQVVGLRELYLREAITVREFATRLPSAWPKYANDPDQEGAHLILRIVEHLAEYQRGDIDEARLRVLIAETQ